MEELIYDVLVIGYGTTSKMLTTLLGRQGWKVGVIDPFKNPYGLPRAVKFNDEILRNLQSIAPISEVERITQLLPDPYTWVNENNEVLMEIPWNMDGISGWPQDAMFNQGELEEIMDDARQEYNNVDMHLGFRAVDIYVNEDNVDIYYRETNELGFVLPNGQAKKVTAKYVVGADGANSFIRNNMPHETTDLGFTSSFVVIDIIPKVEMKFEPTNLQIADPNQPVTVIAGGPGRRRWEFMLMPGQAPEDYTEEVVWEKLKQWDVTPENATLERFVTYTFRARWVNNWRSGRLFLAGDASHLTPPFLGEGLSSGIRDAANLAWKLDLVLKGIAGDALLDTYSSERQPHMQTFIEGAVHLGKVITESNPEKAEKRNQDFKNGNYPPMPDKPYLLSGILYNPQEDELVGRLAMQARVEKEGQEDLFDEFFGIGWRIISFNEDASQQVSEANRQFIESIGGKFVTVSDQDHLAQGDALDVEGKYQEYFESHGIKAVVVRPDFYNYAGVKELSELNKVLETLQEQITK